MVSHGCVKIPVMRPPDYRTKDHPTVDGFGSFGNDFTYDSGQCGSHIHSTGLHLPQPSDDPDDDNDGMIEGGAVE